MVKKMRSIMQSADGFSLLELVVAVAIIAILTAVAVPNFISYRGRSQVAAAVATVDSIRAALSAYAVNDPNNLYPADIADYAALVALAHPLGALLPVNSADVGIAAITYEAGGTPAGSTYTLTVITLAPAGARGYKLTVTPEGVAQSRS
jgi:prepilin-type N-terminal cleavage/methylation domain-containing protein